MIDGIDPEERTCNTLRAAIEFDVDPAYAFASWRCGSLWLDGGGSFGWEPDFRALGDDVYVARISYQSAPNEPGSELCLQLDHYANQWNNDRRRCVIEPDPTSPALVRLRLAFRHDGSSATDVSSATSTALPAATYLLRTWATVAQTLEITRHCALHDEAGSLILEVSRITPELPLGGTVQVGATLSDVLIDYVRVFASPPRQAARSER